jgi:isoquinoline 1-oxidoreductase subunit alpha
MTKLSLKVNGRLYALDVDSSTPLLFVLNDELGLRGPKFGCGMAQCGACTVVLRGQVVRSCVMPVSAVGKDEVTTLEGLEIREALGGVLCRCFTHVRMLRAIRRYAETRKA